MTVTGSAIRAEGIAARVSATGRCLWCILRCGPLNMESVSVMFAAVRRIWPDSKHEAFGRVNGFFPIS